VSILLPVPTVIRLLSLWLLLASGQIWAFGAEGHRRVVAIAESHISSTTAMHIKGIANDTDLGDLSLWPDKIRYLPTWEQSKYWHYVSVDDHEQLKHRKRHSEGDVLSALAYFCDQLGKPEVGAQQQREALAFVLHLVADIHQPLHVGRRDDRGDNRIRVKWPGQKGTTNLHRVWDSLLLEWPAKDPRPPSHQLAAASQQQIDQWQSTAAIDWARESKALRNQVYDFGPLTQGQAKIISPRYINRNKPVVEQRLLMAGVRLAGYLDRLFDSQGPEQQQ
jgi:hypothetical protein